MRGRTITATLAGGLIAGLTVGVPVAAAPAPVAVGVSGAARAEPPAPSTLALIAAAAVVVGATKRAAAEQRLSWPSPGPVESEFGERWGRPHHGLDIDGHTGDPVRAAADGVVASAELDAGYGLTVRVAHSSALRGVTTMYAHLSRVGVRPGQRVARGQVIGRIGATGSATGDHLHFEVHRAGTPIAPRAVLARRAGPGTLAG